MKFENMRRLLSTVRRAVDDYNMIQEGDRIAIGISGGKDSMALATVLHDLKIFYPKKFELVAITADMGFEGSDYESLRPFFDSLEIPYHIIDTHLAEIIFDIRKESNPCSLCAKMRRAILNDEAKKLGCNKLALGHHYDDVVTTFVMNLFNEGRLGSFSPVTYLSRMDITVIRPMVLTREKDISYFCNKNEIPVYKSKCPEDKNTDREKYKLMLDEMEKERKGIYHRIFLAMQKEGLSGYAAEDDKK